MAAPTTVARVGGQMFFSRDSAGTPASPTWDVITNCGDFNLAEGATKIPIKLRANFPRVTYLRGMTDGGVTFKMLHKTGTSDADYAAFESAWQNRTTLYLAFSDYTIATEGAKFIKGTFEVVKFDRGEPVDGEVMVDVEIVAAQNDGGYPLIYGTTPGS